VSQPSTRRSVIRSLASSTQEQHAASFGTWQQALRLDPALELLVQPWRAHGNEIVEKGAPSSLALAADVA